MGVVSNIKKGLDIPRPVSSMENFKLESSYLCPERRRGEHSQTSL